MIRITFFRCIVPLSCNSKSKLISFQQVRTYFWFFDTRFYSAIVLNLFLSHNELFVSWLIPYFTSIALYVDCLVMYLVTILFKLKMLKTWRKDDAWRVGRSLRGYLYLDHFQCVVPRESLWQMFANSVVIIFLSFLISDTLFALMSVLWTTRSVRELLPIDPSLTRHTDLVRAICELQCRASEDACLTLCLLWICQFLNDSNFCPWTLLLLGYEKVLFLRRTSLIFLTSIILWECVSWTLGNEK